MSRTPLKPGPKLALELGPLGLFVLANWKFGIFWATGLFMVASLCAVAILWWREGKPPVMPLISLGIVLVFGSLTIWLQDETFIKIKPTLVYLVFAAVLASGIVLRQIFLKMLLGHTLPLTERGWRLLTWRWIGFFVGMAVLNELVWRNVSTDTWVTFKSFGAIPLTILFMLAQAPLINRHRLDETVS